MIKKKIALIFISNIQFSQNTKLFLKKNILLKIKMSGVGSLLSVNNKHVSLMNNTSHTAVLMSGLNVCDCADSKRCVCWSSGALRVQTVCLSVEGIRKTAVLNHSSRRIYTHQDIEVLRSVVFNVVMLYLTSLTCVNPCVDVVLSPALHVRNQFVSK